MDTQHLAGGGGQLLLDGSALVPGSGANYVDSSASFASSNFEQTVDQQGARRRGSQVFPGGG